MGPFQSEMIAGKIRALTAGHGSTVVLVPGWPETAEAYEVPDPPHCGTAFRPLP